MKDDDKSEEEEEIINLIVSKIVSTDQSFIIEARKFLKRYKDLFSRKLNTIPAKLDPLEIEVDSKKFKVSANQGPPRMMTSEKEQHIKKFIEEGLLSKVIRPSNSAYYSQVHLVPKPIPEPIDKSAPCGPRKWRTTIDYRKFNKCITTQHWPLPNISTMIQRIGSKKPKYFAKLDMTSGYWQAPLAENTKRFTAFITFMGIFEWNRAPMGTQPAGGYFHYQIAFVVLAGLVYTILESYIDDILVHAKNKQEFFENLAKVFNRFRKYRIIFNPDKVFLSDTTMVFVGHEITSEEGVRFSSDKLNGVELIPLPITKGNLKTFVGLANYFRDHVKNHSILSQPLNVLIPNYNRTQKNHKLMWTEELKLAFYTFRDAVANCPMLYFINEE